MFVMEGRQKPLPAPHKHLLIAQRRVGRGNGCYRLPCLSACHYYACSELPGTGVRPPKLSSRRIQSHSSASVPQMLTKASPALADDSWPGLLRTNLFVERSSMNAPPDPAELASCCLFQAAFPLCPFGRNDFFSCSGCPVPSVHLSGPQCPRCLWGLYSLLSHGLCHLTRKH